MNDTNGRHSLAIESPSTFGKGSPKEVQDLMRTMMTAHLIAPNMPERIYTNFDLKFTELLNALYEYYDHKKPRILKTSEKIVPEIKENESKELYYETATSHSGGLDSVYRIAKLLDEGEVPLAVHLRNLNPKGNAYEAIASENQCLAWNVPYLSIKIRNGSGNTGFEAMRTRDLLLALAVVLETAPYKTKKVLIEGGMGQNRDYHFSESARVWEWFNKLIKDIGLDIEVLGVDPGDIETIGQIIDLEKKLEISILPMVQNCFSAPFQIGTHRKKWEKETPNIAKWSSDHWCGSCLKCRRLTLGRIFYKDPRLTKVTAKEIDFFVKDTYLWLKRNDHNRDLISPSFLTHLSAIEG